MLEKIGLLLLSLLAPSAWGLAVEYVFHRLRERREGPGPEAPKPCDAAEGRPE